MLYEVITRNTFLKALGPIIFWFDHPLSLSVDISQFKVFLSLDHLRTQNRGARSFIIIFYRNLNLYHSTRDLSYKKEFRIGKISRKAGHGCKRFLNLNLRFFDRLRTCPETGIESCSFTFLIK